MWSKCVEMFVLKGRTLHEEDWFAAEWVGNDPEDDWNVVESLAQSSHPTQWISHTTVDQTPLQVAWIPKNVG